MFSIDDGTAIYYVPFDRRARTGHADEGCLRAASLNIRLFDVQGTISNPTAWNSLSALPLLLLR